MNHDIFCVLLSFQRMPDVAEDLALTSMRLLINFCFTIRFQNVARDW